MRSQSERMRTHAHEGRARSVVKLRCLLNADQSRSGYVRRVRFLVQVTIGIKNGHRDWWCVVTLHGYFAYGEYLRTLRLVSELPDLRVANANPATASQGEIPSTGHQRKEKHHPNLGGVFFGDAYGNRTHVTAVKGPCLSRLTNAPNGSGCRI